MNAAVKDLLEQKVSILKARVDRIKANIAEGVMVPPAELTDAELALLDAQIELARETKGK